MRGWQVIIVALFALIVAGCSNHKPQVYTSDCITDINCAKPTYEHLLDSLIYYNGKFVEVAGTYRQGRGLSAIVNDSTFSKSDARHSFWINFSPDCPLYSPATHQGFFEASDGQYKSFDDSKMVVRGRLQLHEPSDNNPYIAILNDIVYVQLK